MATDAKKLIRSFERLRGKRGVWEAHWQDIADIVLPSRQFTNKLTPGEKRTRRIFDSTATKAVMRLASALHGNMINPSIQWFGLRPQRDDLNEIEAVRDWLDDARNRMLTLYSTTRFGFNTQSFEAFLDLVAFGTAVMIFHEFPDRIQFQTRPLSECFIDADADDKVNIVHRFFEMQAEKVAGKFGIENLHTDVQEALNRGDDMLMMILHTVAPREHRDPSRLDGPNKRFESTYLDFDRQMIIRESGFDVFPYLVPRWSKASGEVYGRSPTMLNLADIGMVNAMRKTNIISAEQTVSPPWVVDAGGIEGPLRIAPNSIIYKRTGSTSPIEPLITGNRVDLGEAMLEKERNGIREGFFLDLISLPLQDRMTTTEVLQRIQQQQVVLSPIVARIQEEWLGPMISRTFDAMFNLGMLPPFPAELAGETLVVDFVSTMALSQKASESVNFERWISGLTAMAAADPTIFDHVDTDELAKYAAGTWFSVPGRLVRSDDEVAQIRQERREAAEAQAQLVAAREAAAAGKDATQAVAQATEAGL